MQVRWQAYQRLLHRLLPSEIAFVSSPLILLSQIPACVKIRDCPVDVDGLVDELEPEIAPEEELVALTASILRSLNCCMSSCSGASSLDSTSEN